MEMLNDIMDVAIAMKSQWSQHPFVSTTSPPS